MRMFTRIGSRIIAICKLVPLLPVVIVAAVPLALLWDYRPWGSGPDALWGWPVNPSLGQWIVIALVLYTVVDTLIGMVDDIRHGHVGVDVLAVVAILSTLAVQEYWASWAVTLMIASGEAIEEYAQAKAESSLTALLKAAPQIAHVVDLPGVGGGKRGEARNGSGSGVAGANGGAEQVTQRSSGSSGSSGEETPWYLAQAASSSASSASSVSSDGFRRVAAAPKGGGHNEVNRATQSQPASEHRGEGASSSSPASAPTSSLASATSAAHYRSVPVQDVQLNDVLVVLPGETVPVDGELLSGSATLDLSNINGEPVPREVYAGAQILSGAVNGASMITMRASKLAHDSQYQRILELVSSAQESRPAVVKTADLLAVPFTVISFVIAGLAWFISGTPLRFAQVLVLATPCPLLIAAPVAYMAGTGRLAKAGVLIKAQEVLENLGRVTHVFFDKTGTLTVKQPQVVRVDMAKGLNGPAARLNKDHVLMFAGVVESYSVHILAKGIAAAGNAAIARLHDRYDAGQRRCPEPEASWTGHGRDYPVVKHVREDAGNGVIGEVNGHEVRVGRYAFVTSVDGGFMRSDGTGNDLRPRFAQLAPDEMASYVAVDGQLVARVVLKDVPRSNAKAAIGRLKELGVTRLTMLTGDKAASAKIIAGQIGIDDVRAELFPEDKVNAVAQASDEITMMVGDGVNDAPVLASATIGMAITDGMSTAASESAQVVIMNDDIVAVPRAIAIARRTKRVMLQAVIAGLALAVIGMVAAAFNLIPVVVGAFLQEAIDVVSILWALTALLDRD